MSKRLNQTIVENASVSSIKSGSLVLKYSGAQISLTNPAGKLTLLGKSYNKKTNWEPPQSGYDQDQNFTRVGDREFVVFRDGTRKLARRYDAGSNDFVYTRLGKSFMNQRKTLQEYVLSLPIIVSGKNKRTGASYSRIGYLPHQALGVNNLRPPYTYTTCAFFNPAASRVRSL